MPRKVAIIGTGQVGMACAYSLLIQHTVESLVLVDVNIEKAMGEAMDLIHGIPFLQPIDILAGTLADCAQADIVIVTAGAKQRQGEDRLALVQRNVEIFRTLIPKIIAAAPEAVLLIVSNPVDVMTYVSWQLSELPWTRVLGSGTILDTARFRSVLAARFQLDPRSLHAYIIGEHGDSEVAVWSKVHVAGSPILNFFPDPSSSQERLDIATQVRTAAQEIIRRKGATSYAIGLGVTQMVEVILNNHQRVLTVSGLLQGEYGLHNVCLSLPMVVGSSGIQRILPIALDPEEEAQLRQSGALLQSVIRSVGF